MRIPVILALSMARFIAFAQEASDADQWLRRAQRAFEAGDWTAAGEAAAKAQMANPRLADAYVLLGLVATKQNKIAASEQLFRKAALLEPANYRTLSYLGSSYLQQGRAAEAIEAFNGVLRMDPQNPSAHYHLGLIDLSAGRATQAWKHFNAVLLANSRDIPARIGALESDLVLKDGKAARQAARDLDQFLPLESPDRLRVGALLGSHEQYAETALILEKIPVSVPHASEVSFNLALALYHLNDFERAAKTLERSPSLRDNAEALNLLGEIEEARQHPAEAGTAYRRATELGPEKEELWFGYGLFLLRQERTNEAESVFAAGLANVPGSVPLRLGRAVALSTTKGYSESVQLLLKLAADHPSVALTYHLLGQLYEAVPEQENQIVNLLAGYLKTDPGDPLAYYYYGKILFLRTESEAAKEALQKALTLNPQLPEAYWQLAVIAQAEGRSSESLPLLRKALALKPDLWNAHYRLALALRKLGFNAEAEKEMGEYIRHKDAEAALSRQVMVDALSVSAPSPKQPH